jgi:hypothetical protein
MTIESVRKLHDDKADFLITCDEHGCQEALDATDRTFAQAVTFLKAKGWRINRSFGSWLHACPKHSQKAE